MTMPVGTRCYACLLTVLALTVSSDPVSAQRKLTWTQLDEATRLVKLVDGVADGKLAGGDAWLKWEPHFLRGEDANVYVPYTLVIDEAPGAFRSISMYVRATYFGESSKEGKARGRQEAYIGFEPGQVPINVPERQTVPRGTPTASENAAMIKLAHPEDDGLPRFPFEAIHFIDLAQAGAREPYVVRRGLTIPPGDYDFYVSIREAHLDGNPAPDAKSAVLKRHLTVPPFSRSTLQMSSVILAEDIRTLTAPLTPDEQLRQPYALGLVDIVPVRDHLFSADDTLSLVFFVYDAAVGANNTPNVSVSYTFFEHTGAAEEVFSATAPQEFNAETLPEQFDLDALGNQLPVSQAVPLHTFPEGSYRLQIGVTDHIAESRVVDSVSFVVTPGSNGGS